MCELEFVPFDLTSIAARANRATVGVLNFILALIGLAGVGALVYAFGWPQDIYGESMLFGFAEYMLLVFGMCEIGLLGVAPHMLSYMRENVFSLLAAILAISISFGSGHIREAIWNTLGERNIQFGLLSFVIATQMAVLIPLFLKWLRYGRRGWMTHIQPRTIVIGSFVSIILAGAALMMTPNATTHGIRWIDALFTSTSAVCVTGLTSVDTAAAFTLHGQVVILLLMQAGGLGVMTFTFFLSMLAGEGISLHDRVLLRDVISERNIGFISRILLEIVVVTVFIEAIGATLIWWQLQGLDLPGAGTLWHSIFHSVAAFCNAGFSTFSGNLAEPVIAHLRYMQAIIMVLIILGGIGFPVLRELRQRGLSYLFPSYFQRTSHMTLHTRMVLYMTFVLLVGGTLLIYACQYVGTPSIAPSLWRAAFDSVTARTAGFNIADVGSYSVSVTLVIIFLMFVGGSPAGTAGGVKTTTFALAIMNLWTIVREKREIQIGKRSISQRTANLAFAILVISIAWVGLASFAMSVVEPTKIYLDLLFETVSAFGTVGLSRNLTPLLNDEGKIIIITTMFIGRIGLIMIASALLHSRSNTLYSFPKEDVTLT